MANPFETPIAARPMSEFSALPLDFIDRSVQRKQAMFDETKANIAAVEDELLKTNALPGDRARQQELLKQYESEIDTIVESVGGDYSRVGGQLDALKQSMQRELSYGELGSINTSYASAMQSKQDLDKRFADKKIGYAGRALGMKAISDYKTTANEDGSFSSFSAYSPSNIVDPVAEMHKSVKNIHAKFDEQGTEFVPNSVVSDNLDNAIQSNPEIMRALVENFKYTYPNGSQEDFKKYYSSVRDRVIQDRTYKKATKSLSGSGSRSTLMPGTVLNDWQQPRRVGGINKRTGGNAAKLRALGEWVGFDTTAEHERFINSEEGRRMVSYMEQKTGIDMPTDYLDQIDWFESNAGASKKSSIILGEADPKVLQYAITDDGFLNYGGAVYRQDGTIESADDTRQWQGKSEDGNTARIIGVVEEGGMYPKGSYVFIGKDGMRIQEPGDPKTLQSQSFNRSQINSSRLTNTGSIDINLHANVTSPSTGKVLVPRGKYKSVHDIASGSIILYQNGKPMYIQTIEDGVEVIKKVN